MMSKRITTLDYVERAKEIHGDTYDYTTTVYTKSQEFVTIVCSVHGPFTMRAYCHTSLKQGCKRCGCAARGVKQRKNTITFVDEANKIHSHKYTYDKIQYTTTKKKVNITCPIHGDFLQSPNSHLSGLGCVVCGYESNKISNIVDRFCNVHGDVYDYSNVVYNRIDDPVAIICRDHGEFMQLPQVHLTGSRCPTCAALSRRGGYSSDYFTAHSGVANAVGSLYLIELVGGGEKFIKIGITLQHIQNRFSGQTKKYQYRIIHTIQYPMVIAYDIEQRLITAHQHYQYTPKRRIKGWTECFDVAATVSVMEMMVVV